jgi:hypothetical protein
MKFYVVEFTHSESAGKAMETLRIRLLPNFTVLKLLMFKFYVAEFTHSESVGKAMETLRIRLLPNFTVLKLLMLKTPDFRDVIGWRDNPLTGKVESYSSTSLLTCTRHIPRGLGPFQRRCQYHKSRLHEGKHLKD